MQRRLLAWVAALAALGVVLGFAGLDRPLAEWVRASGLEQARVFAVGLGTLDTISGYALWIWAPGPCVLLLGLAGLAWRRAARWPRVLVGAAAVQLATLAVMSVGKDHFGRLRPQQVLDSGDCSHVWYAGGVSFPSGHSAFYFGLCLPLAAACPERWQRVLLLAVPLFAVLARIDLARHFLSDVCASALVAALFALLATHLGAGAHAEPARRL